jgi:hypothetical protein
VFVLSQLPDEGEFIVDVTHRQAHFALGNIGAGL